MNLGNVYLAVFLVLVLTGALATFTLLLCTRFWLRLPWTAIIVITICLAPITGGVLNYYCHRLVFVRWHQAQNKFVPPAGCLSYDPDFARLNATYQMTLPQFNAWVAGHPWKLMPGSNDLLLHDGQAMGFSNPQLSFETETGANGKQMRVYFKSGVMYLAYNSM